MFKDEFTQAILTTSALSIFIAGAFGSFGSMSYYLYLVVKGRHQYSFATMIIYMVLGLCVGFTADRLMIEYWEHSYHGLILLSGILSIKIFDFLDINGLNLLAQKTGLPVKKE